MSSPIDRSSAHPSMTNAPHLTDSARQRWETRVFPPPPQIATTATLAEILQSQGPLPDHLVSGIGVGIAQYLDVLHQAGHVHGDVRPASVLLPGNNVLWLTDPAVEYRACSAADDLTSLVITLVECTTGLALDASAEWTPELLIHLGCSPVLAEAIGAIRPHAGAERATLVLARPDQALPQRSNDLA
jgi:hypothetical protein